MNSLSRSDSHSFGEYEIAETISGSGPVSLHRARKKGEAGTVLLRRLSAGRASPSDMARFRREYQKLRSAAPSGLATVLGVVEQGKDLIVVLEDAGGIPLDSLLARGAPDLKSALRLASVLSMSLGEIHKRKIIHGDVKPANILVDAKACTAMLLGSGIDRILTHEDEDAASPSYAARTLAYLAPEQSGRTGRAVDHRSDLYSLGVVLYEMLTGAVPFSADDALGLIHSHIARMPAAPADIERSIPSVVSAIVMKLLEKAPEDRYQNSLALYVDLRACLDGLSAAGRIGEFPIAQNDGGPGFPAARVFIGRDDEKRVLLEAFARSRGSGREMVLVHGPPGIGKTALVREALAAMHGARIARGKFDQYSGGIPYSGIAEAFEDLAAGVAAAGPQGTAALGIELSGPLGGNAGIICGMAPGWETILGRPAPLIALDPRRARNRLIHAIGTFISAIAGGAPFVIFLDDLQWADPASLELLKAIVRDPGVTGFLFVGTYRDDEASRSPHLEALLSEARGGIPVRTVALAGLDEGTVKEFVSKTMPGGLPRLELFSGAVRSKTGGNPLSMLQFLKSLFDADMISPTVGSVRGAASLVWDWDVDAVLGAPMAADVAEHMIRKFSDLPESAQEMLNVASCMGGTFSADLIAAFRGICVEEAGRSLSPALGENLVTAEGDLLRFSHDRIREAVYSSLPPQKRSLIHLGLGRIMLKNAGREPPDERIAAIADQMNRGVSLIEDHAERRALAELNLRAGRKTKRDAAYASALGYLEIGIRLCGDWDGDYDLALPLLTEAAGAAALSADFDLMRGYSDAVINHARTLLDALPVYELQLQSYLARGSLQEGIDSGLKIAGMLGVELPARPSRFRIALELAKSRIALARRMPEDIADIRVSTDPRIVGMMRILDIIGTMAFLSRPSLLMAIIAKAIVLSVRHGTTVKSPFTAYFGYGLILTTIGDIENGYRFGKLALALIEKLGAEEDAPRIMVNFNAFLRHWKEHVGNSLQPLLEAYRKAREMGDLEWAGLAIGHYGSLSFSVCRTLGEIESELLEIEAILAGLRQEPFLQAVRARRQLVRILTGADPRNRLKGRAYDEDDMRPKNTESANRTMLFVVPFFKLMISFTFCRYPEALGCAEEAEKQIEAATGMYNLPLFYFFDSLTRAALCDDAAEAGVKKHFLRKIRRNQRRMRLWASHAPMNHRHKYDLVEAEIARVRGEYGKAAALYGRAISGARENGFLQEEAICSERAARCLLQEGRRDLSLPHIQESHRAYAAWGAAAKARELEREFPDARFTAPRENASPGISRLLDVATVVKASRAVSGETDLGSLLEKVLGLAMENAGARRGLIILERGGALAIEAECRVGGGVSKPGGGASAAIPAALIRSVIESGESIVIDDAEKDKRFAAERYFRTHGVTSALCAPIMNNGSAIGVVYLEHDLARGAFTRDRLDILALLATQAGASISNCLLRAEALEMQRLEREAAERESFYKDIEHRADRLELELLKKSIQPHFLMNTLTAIKAWLAENPAQSARIIDALAEEIRPLAERSAMKEIPIREEIAICKAHLEIMGLRLNRRFTLTVSGVGGEEAVPPLVFHTMVENAFTHGDSSAFSRFDITKTVDGEITRYVFSVDDPAAGKGPVREGTGMKYIRARLEESYPGRWELDCGGGDATWRVTVAIREGT